MDWEDYRKLGVGTPFEDKLGRQNHPGGGSGWHWARVHKPGEEYQGGAPPLPHGLEARRELEGLPLPELQQRAEAAGADPNQIREAAASADPEENIITLVEVLALGNARRAIDLASYPLPAEAERVEGVPEGELFHHEGWRCEEFAETTREFWVYVPRQYVPGTAARVVICQDGHRYLDPEGEIRVGVVLDNMIAAGELEPTLALFIRPGVPLPDEERTEKGLCPKGDVSRTDWERSFEYDSVSGKYGDMLIKELLPFVEAEHGVTISSEPKHRLIMGHSSGGVASMAAGFTHPEAFGCVVSHCASYVNIRGAHQLPWAVRNSERRDLRVLLLIGTNDNDNDHGNNQLGNEQLGAALDYAGYDSTLVIGSGYHNRVHASHVFPDTLRWMFCGAEPPTEFARGAHASKL